MEGAEEELEEELLPLDRERFEFALVSNSCYFPTLLEEGLVGQVSISFWVAVCPDYDYFIVPTP